METIQPDLATRHEVDSQRPLSGLQLLTEYRSGVHDLVHDFYLPCLHRSTLYRRAVGFFTSHGLSAAAQGISTLVHSEGRMLLVASPLFEKEDLEAIQHGYCAREDVLVKALLREIEATPDGLVRDRLGYLAWLIGEERLEIQIALPIDKHGGPRRGIYHEKLGLFSDQTGNCVAFTGSPNETGGGLVDNFEAIDVFWSWDDAHGRVATKLSNFDRLWNDNTAGLSVIEFPTAARQHLLRYRHKNRPPLERQTWPGILLSTGFPSMLWRHQVKAIRCWEKNRRKGLISMATGTGKTLTALIGAQRCPSLQLLVIAVPRGALVDQWAAELKDKTGFAGPTLAYETSSRWQEPLFNRLRAARLHREGQPVVVIGTMHSLAGHRFQSVLTDAGVPDQSLLIVDEVHNAGAPTFQQILRKDFKWRLGLSATPTRHFDEIGTRVLRSYFDTAVFVYDLRRALRDGHLCPYQYYVIAAHLGDTEYAEYRSLTRRLIQLRGRGVPEDLTVQTDNAIDSDSKQVQRLLFRRASILKKCHSKLEALRRALGDIEIQRGLIYCADNEQLGNVADVLQQQKILHLTYTAETPTAMRRSALESLEAGHVPVLAAINCLDEGIDIPTVNEAIIMASSSNKRQFVQRRGRILRRAPGKSTAILVDIVALPPQGAGREARRMLNGELARIKEMAELAENRHQVLRTVKKHASQYGVLLSELLTGEGDG